MRFYKKIKANHLIRWQNYKNLFKIKIFCRILFQIQTFFYNKIQKWEQKTRNEFICTALSFTAFFDSGCLIW